MKAYRHIFFDLDHTLWDYQSNASDTLHELYKEYALDQKVNFSAKALVQKFFKVTDAMWDDFNKGKILKTDIRKRRFSIVFKALGTPPQQIPAGFEQAYLDLCPAKAKTIPFANELLNYLMEKEYRLHVITNGFEEIQAVKIKSAGLNHYFGEVITSENAGFRKPDKRIFEWALDKTGAVKEQSLMIGDNPVADIAGAGEFGMDQVFFNPEGNMSEVVATYEISSLEQLTELL